jgi:hypothetical protein
MHTTRHSPAAFALGVLLITVVGLAPSVAQEQGSQVKAADQTNTGMRYEILSLKRRDGGTQTLRVIYEEHSGGTLRSGGLASKD